MSAHVIQGDCVRLMGVWMPPNSVDAIVTDPPYGIEFMGREWDRAGTGIAMQRWHERWAIEAYRVLKPGGHLLAFGGTRTYHRLACALEDAGFEIRDCLSWLYGSGFPKSHDISKAIDKANGRCFEDRYALGRHIRERREALGLTCADVNSWFGYRDGCQHWERQDASGARVPTLADWNILADRLALSDEWAELVERVEAEREVIGETRRGAQVESTGRYGAWGDGITPTAPATAEAAEWAGWGTALKPAWEPIILARKPIMRNTVAQNVQAFGTGALNIDGCRIGFASSSDIAQSEGKNQHSGYRNPNSNRDSYSGEFGPRVNYDGGAGRWPANLVLDTEAAAMLDAQSGDRPVSGSARNGRPATGNDYDQSKTVYGIGFGSIQGALYDDAGGASRFFYVPKASREERNAGLAGMAERKPHADEPNGRAWDIPGSHSTPRANHHPTVKPVELMRWLIRLITPPGGIVLDPFNGSGSTGCAAAAEGVAYIGLELDADYCEISRRRIAWWMREAEIERQQLRMFAVEEVPTIAADTKMQALSLF